ncbi:MAG: dihydroorotase [Methanomassiliicoccales archaeon]|nr:MAG: dihydroorotase [Methanomassiliicoccales archaeon]
MEIVIEGNAFINGDLVKCAIGVEEGRIKAVKKILKGDRHYDFGDKLILPGGIDAHVHFRDPGMTHKEDFGSGTVSAAFGGVTCALDMPNTIPPTTSKEALQEKARIAGSKAFVDFGLFAGVSMNSDFEELSKHATAFKIYLATTTGRLLIRDYNVLDEIFQRLGATNKTVCVHCEDEDLINKTMNPDSLKSHLKSRPNPCEASSIKKVIRSSRGAKVHICHVSTSKGVKLVKTEGVTSEVAPHHLFLNSNVKLGALGKVNPPLREPKDQEALWEALNSNIIDIIASDHAPHTLEEKELFEEAPAGIPGVETMLPLMLSLVKHNKFQLGRLVNAVSEKPNEIFHLNKGKLSPGYDADMIAVDLRKEGEIKGKNLHSKCGWTPYEGFNGVFPRFTFVRGEVVIEDWELTGERGFGSMVGESLGSGAVKVD